MQMKIEKYANVRVMPSPYGDKLHLLRLSRCPAQVGVSIPSRGQIAFQGWYILIDSSISFRPSVEKSCIKKANNHPIEQKNPTKLDICSISPIVL